MPRDSKSVVSFYQFFPLAHPQGFRTILQTEADRLEITGTVLLAQEGVNASICGNRAQAEQFMELLSSLWSTRFEIVNWSGVPEDIHPFRRFKVKVKSEIITMGIPTIDPVSMRGVYVSPQQWNHLISDPKTLVLDTRNEYEVAAGTFEYAANPNITRFRDFPHRVSDILEETNPDQVALFCTGGIRCEKASAYLRSLGIPRVYHLKGGILSYLTQIPASKSLWTGQCFLFDDRIGIDYHGLHPTKQDA